MQLSEHFTLEEFLRSQTAARLGREIVPSPAEVENLKTLCVTVLEPIRSRLGRQIVVTSGLRPEWLNVSIGGASKSAHMTGRAADIQAVGMTPTVFAGWIRNQELPLDKCILEFPDSSGGGWVHVQIPEGGNKPRNEYLLARSVAGATVYEVMV